MSQPDTPTQKTLNWRAYNEELKRRGSLTIWFDPEMTWEAENGSAKVCHGSGGIVLLRAE